MKILANPCGKSDQKILIAVAAVVIIGIAAYFLLFRQSPANQAVTDLKAYIEGVQNRNFDVVFNHNGVVQRRKAIIDQRTEGNKEKELKDLYDESKSSFDQAAPTSDPRAQWAEKSFFIPGANFKVLGVEMVEDKENPSQPASDRINAVITVEVDYPDKNTAPDLNGKVKSVVYKVTMVNSKNISRVIRTAVEEKKWLFMTIGINSESIKYQ